MDVDADLAEDDIAGGDGNGDDIDANADMDVPVRAAAVSHVRGKRKRPKEKDLPLGTHLKIDADDSLEAGPEPSGGMVLARLGRVVRVDSQPFDPERFQRLEDGRDDIGVINVVRWRFDPETGEQVRDVCSRGAPASFERFLWSS